MKYLICFFFLFIFLKAFSQLKNIELRSTSWQFKSGGSISEFPQIDNEAINIDDLGKLKSSNLLKSYKVFKVPLQIKSNEAKHNFLKFIVGVSDKLNGLFIIDANCNNIFADDSIYNFNIEESKNFEIAINSIPIRDNVNNISLEKSNFYAKPAARKDKISGEVIFTLSLILKDYYPVLFNLNSITYELAIYSHPVTQNFFSKPFLYWGNNRLRYVCYRRKADLRDSILQGGLVYDLKENSNFPLIIDNFRIFLLREDTLSTNVSLKFSKNMSDKTAEKKISEILSQSIKNGKLVNEPFLALSNKYKLLFFSGSWCNPCREVLPYFKKTFYKFNTKLDFKEILVERDSITAINYSKVINGKHEIYYENLYNKNTNSIISYFDIKVFPTFILLDTNNRIVDKQTSAEGLKMIEKILSRF